MSLNWLVKFSHQAASGRSQSAWKTNCPTPLKKCKHKIIQQHYSKISFLACDHIYSPNPMVQFMLRSCWRYAGSQSHIEMHEVIQNPPKIDIAHQFAQFVNFTENFTAVVDILKLTVACAIFLNCLI